MVHCFTLTKQDSKTMNFIIITYSAFHHLKFFNLSTELCFISLIRNELFNNKFTDLNPNTFMYLQEIRAGVRVRESQLRLSLLILEEFADFCECKRIIHALVVSELDHCNTILYWLPKSRLNQLCVIKYVVIVHRGVRQERNFICLSNDGAYA